MTSIVMSRKMATTVVSRRRRLHQRALAFDPGLWRYSLVRRTRGPGNPRLRSFGRRDKKKTCLESTFDNVNKYSNQCRSRRSREELIGIFVHVAEFVSDVMWRCMTSERMTTELNAVPVSGVAKSVR